jgi:type II secretory pathway pseudopilin PulG
MLKQRGDTLIEVLFAFSVFSLVAVGALTIMNQGSNVSERSLEISLVRSQLNAQAETLRFLHDSYTSTYQPGQTFNPNATNKPPAWQWQAMEDAIISAGATTATDLGSVSSSCPTNLPSGSFILDSQAGTYVSQANMAFLPATTYAQVQYSNGPKPQGIWIEGIRSDPNNKQGQQNLGYIDFHILACWPGVGTNIPMTLGTVVRLYESR